MTPRFVVTGTDTGVGKTVFAAALADALDGVYWKPIQCGLEDGGDREAVSRFDAEFRIRIERAKGVFSEADARNDAGLTSGDGRRCARVGWDGSGGSDVSEQAQVLIEGGIDGARYQSDRKLCG